MAISKQSQCYSSFFTAASYPASKMSSNFPVLNDLHSTEAGGIKGQISQIPGLSPTINLPSGERVRGRRTGVRESDSDYVKLAKQGGHKGLLCHEDTVISKANSYKPPDWYHTASEDNRIPCILINGEEKKKPQAFQPLEPPFGTDSMSAWERGSSRGHDKEKNSNAHCSQMEIFQSPSQYHQTSKFKRIVFDKRTAPAEMSKLLRFGYAGNDKPIVNTDLSN